MKKDNKLPPFEQAKYNIKKFCANFVVCESAIMLMKAVETMEELDEDEKEDIDKVCASTLRQLSDLIESRGATWD